jgi:hypothetical protein
LLQRLLRGVGEPMTGGINTCFAAWESARSCA